MSLVGEVILGFREQATDLPQLMTNAPVIGVPVVVGSGGNFGTGASPLFIKATVTNAFGESVTSGEQSATITGPNSSIQIQVSSPIAASFIRVYYGSNGTGSEYVYEQFPFSTNPQTVTIVNSGQTVASPPTRSTIYLPDTDGSALSAFAAFRWMNKGLEWAASKNRGGLPDFGAVGTTNGQPLYVMNGYWKKIDTAWFDGYPQGLLNKSSVFRRQPVPGFSGCLIVHQASDRLIVEMWPQPNRTSAQTTLVSPMGVSDTTATLTSAASYVLGFGKTLIDSEMVEFAAISGNTLTGLTRGMGGTAPAAHLAGATVTELNLEISGFRVPAANYVPGQSLSTLYLPPGWVDAIVSYMLYLFRSAEQDDKAAQRYLAEATQKMSDLSANRIIAGPRQINPYGSRGPEVAAGMGSVFGGIIIP